MKLNVFKDGFLADLRWKAGLTQKQMGALLGCSRHRIGRIERMGFDTPLFLLVWYAHGLGLEINISVKRRNRGQARG